MTLTSWQKARITTKSAAARILGIPASKIKSVSCGLKNPVVTLTDETLKVLKFNLFMLDFVSERRRKAADLVVEPLADGIGFAVESADGSDRYLVEIEGDRLVCGCIDCHENKKLFPHFTCKHGYAALNSMGYVSLHNFLNQQKTG